MNTGSNYGVNSPIITFSDFSATETGLDTTGDRLLYALPLEVSGDLVIQKSALSGEAEFPGLIIEELTCRIHCLLST